MNEKLNHIMHFYRGHFGRLNARDTPSVTELAEATELADGS